MKNYLVLTNDICLSKVRSDPPVYQCWACDLQLYHVVMISPRELLDHVELHKRAGHIVPPSAIEAVQKELA